MFAHVILMWQFFMHNRETPHVSSHSQGTGRLQLLMQRLLLSAIFHCRTLCFVNFLRFFSFLPFFFSLFFPPLFLPIHLSLLFRLVPCNILTLGPVPPTVTRVSSLLPFLVCFFQFCEHSFTRALPFAPFVVLMAHCMFP